jgi:alkyl hydroperoxide reductase subunit F
MVEIKMFSKSYCPYCNRAKKVLDSMELEYTDIDVTNGNTEEFEEAREKEEFYTVPMIYIGGKFIGGSLELSELIESGEFEELIKN